MGSPPVGQRPIPFAFRCCELLGYVVIGHDVNPLCLYDTQRRLCPVGHNTQVAGFRQRHRRLFIRPHQAGCRPLGPGQYQPGELVGAGFVVIEMKRLHEARCRVFLLRPDKQLPKWSNRGWDSHGSSALGMTGLRPPAKRAIAILVDRWVRLDYLIFRDQMTCSARWPPE